MKYRTITVDIADGIAVGTLANPPKQLMNFAMVQDLLRFADDMEARDDVRVVILTGGADGIFITHYDVGELAAMSTMMRQQQAAATPNESRELHPAHQAFNKLHALSKPVIAALNGTAMGGGCELALACDLRYMADVGMIGLPESTVGILPGAGGTQRLSRLLGTAKALELMLLGQVVSPQHAEAVGIVHKVVPRKKLMGHCKTIARTLASRPAITLTNIKKAVYEGIELPLLDALRLEQRYFDELMRSSEALALMKQLTSQGGILNNQSADD